MNQKKTYEEVNIELIYLEPGDLITTSSPLGEGGFDKDGWA